VEKQWVGERRSGRFALNARSAEALRKPRKREPFEAQGKQGPRTPKEVMMCPACLAALAMMVAGTASTGGLAAMLVNKFRVKKGVKKMVGVGRSEWTQTKEKET
jgi:hypothetical protein